jgi:DNA gyrase inhibitor GyrI
MMSELDVRIVELEPMRVASAHGFGKSPEEQAWTKLIAWAQGKGLLDDLATRRFYGFNDPDPSPGSPNYGYEQWMTVGPDVASEGEVEIKTVPGGLYAVARCTLGTIGEVWKRLVTWREDSTYNPAAHQWLEEALTPPVDLQIGSPDAVLDLHLPIAR